MAVIERMVAMAHYLEREFGVMTDYSIAPEHRIDVAYSTTEDGEHDVMVLADVYGPTLEYYFDGKLVCKERMTEAEWIQSFECENLFDTLIGDAESYGRKGKQ